MKSVSSINDNSHSSPGNTQGGGVVWSFFLLHPSQSEGLTPVKYLSIWASNQKKSLDNFILESDERRGAVLPFWGCRSRLASADPQQAPVASLQAIRLWNKPKNWFIIIYLPTAACKWALSVSVNSHFPSSWWCEAIRDQRAHHGACFLKHLEEVAAFLCMEQQTVLNLYYTVGLNRKMAAITSLTPSPEQPFLRTAFCTRSAFTMQNPKWL